jgi:O26-antigen biosynthesis N-acetyl-L-fucosamine transferase
MDFIAKLGLKNKVVFFFGGNTGHAQDMESVMRLAKILYSTKEAHFLIIGQGDEFDLMQSLKSQWNLENVPILPSVSQAEFRSILPFIDIGLFSLVYSHTAHNFPGKLPGYMVEFKPILGSVNPGNDLVALIHGANAGFVDTNSDDELWANAPISLAHDHKLHQEMGENFRALLLRELSVESAATNILNSVKL